MLEQKKLNKYDCFSCLFVKVILFSFNLRCYTFVGYTYYALQYDVLFKIILLLIYLI